MTQAVKKRKLAANKYKCDQCDFRSLSKANIRYHSVVHTGKKPFVCTFPGCNYQAGWKSSLQKHLITHDPDRDRQLVYHCDKCDYRAATKSTLKKHEPVHLNSKPFACDYPSCNFRTRFKQVLARHKKIKHEQEWKNLKIYSCEQCDYRSKFNHNLINHVKTHSSDKPFACEFYGCKFRSRLAWNLKVHVRRHHDPTETFVLSCTVDGCAFKTVYKHHLKNHLGTHNPNCEPKFVCTLCLKRFHALDSLQNHVARTHTGEESYSCKLCKIRFNRNAALKKHVKKAHASELERDNEGTKIQQRYKCGFCDYTNILKYMVINHERTHTGEKPFACSVCSFRANARSYLKQHMQNVHGPRRRKMFECHICSVKFCAVGNRERHMKTQHSNRPQMIFRCQFCNHSTKCKRNLDLHVRTQHHGKNHADKHKSASSSKTGKGLIRKKKYHCRVGDCSFSTAYLPNRCTHEHRHDPNRRNIKCPLCPKNFFSMGELRSHIRQKHTEEKPFECQYCNYSAPFAYSMKMHMRKHRHKGPVSTTGTQATTTQVDGGKNVDGTESTGHENKLESSDCQQVHEKPKISRVFACGWCGLLSLDCDAALVHSVGHRTLIITLERVAIR